MSNSEEFHIPVLVEEAIEGLQIRPAKKYIDATLGGGGHGVEIVKRGGVLLGIDVDQDALEFARQRLDVGSEKLEGEEGWKLVQGNFRDIEIIAKEQGFENVSGILFDLGVSTFQLKKSGRGLSFGRDEPLDMRLGNREGISAREIVNSYSEDELYDLLIRFGEEELARPIARVLIHVRRTGPITTTAQLADLVGGVYQHEGKRSVLHPATKVFQALRIAVNRELDSLERGLEGAVKLLESGGRLAIISFHSLEDRIVKFGLRRDELRLITKKPIRPNLLEMRQNPASRSAKLRIAQKL